MYLDEDVSWNEHVDHLARKISAAVGRLKQVRPFVTQETLLTIYVSNIAPFWLLVWDTLNKDLAERLQNWLQNRSSRVITSSSYEIRSNDILKQLEWKKLSDRRLAHSATMMYKILNGQAPEYLQEMFLRLYNKTSYNVRNRELNLAILKPRTENLRNSFAYREAKTLYLLR